MKRGERSKGSDDSDDNADAASRAAADEVDRVNARDPDDGADDDASATHASGQAPEGPVSGVQGDPATAGRRAGQAPSRGTAAGGQADFSESAAFLRTDSGSGELADALPGDLEERTEVGARVTLKQVDAVGAGTVLGNRYQIEATLGEGGSGTVYRAWDRMLGELVAVKILHAQRAREKSWIKRLAREVKVARAIGHPNVCRVFELGNADGHWFVTMELAAGGSLRDLLRAPPLAANGVGRPLGDRLRDIREICAGLAAMHAVGIIHRDVTPQNILRMADGRLVLTDFGLAIESGDHTTVHGGTPAYLPPEAARGERSDLRSDVFQLGMIMHEVITGIRPTWSADGARLLLMEPEPGASAVEEEVLRLVADCVIADPARRPPSAVAVAGRLAAAEVAQPAPFLVRVVVRGRKFVRRHRRLMMAAATAAVLAGIVRTVQIVSRPPLCRGAAQQLAGIWDPPRAEAVRRAFVQSGKTYAAESYARSRQILDDYAARWAHMYTDACQATHLRGEQSAEVLDLRMGCLKDAQGELQALTDLFSSGDGEVVSRSINAASALSSVDRCADVRVLKAVVRPPDDQQMRAKVESLRQRLSEVKALQSAGRLGEGARRATPLVTEAREIGYEPLLAEALDARGRVEFLSGSFERVAATLDEAMLVAEASHHDRLLAEAAVDKVSLLGSSGYLDELIRFMPRVQATLKRIGGDERLQGWIYAGLAQAYMLRGRFAESLVNNQKALDAKRRVLPEDHWDVALSVGNVAAGLHALGRNQEALEQNQRAVATLERALGRQHPDLALQIYNRGEIRLALGQVPEARADFERALAIWKDEFPAEHMYNSYPLTGLGLAALADGKGVDAAIALLERALKIREVAKMAPEMRAETMFALAQALWRAESRRPRDRQRALELAEMAREMFPLPEKANERAAVDTALASWRGEEKTALRGAEVERRRVGSKKVSTEGRQRQ